MIVRVISHDGVSHLVKLTPHTTVRQILEEVCGKSGLPLDKFNLRFEGKVLDHCCRLHYADLNEETNFDLVECMESNHGPICVSFEVNCFRFIGSFIADDSILKVVTSLCPGSILNRENGVPAISCMQYKVIGFQKLEETTLKTLGINNGNIVMRMEMHDLDDLPRVNKSSSRGGNKSKPMKEQAKITKPVPSRQSDEPKAKVANIGSVPVVVPTDFHYSGERNLMLFTVPDDYKLSGDPSDDFFDLKLDEAKKIMRDLQNQRQVLDNQPLMTQAMRQQIMNENAEKKLSFYKKTVIRILFPDRIILQGVFESHECVKNVYDFVRVHLEHPDIPFYLYCTPPKIVLELEKRLIDVNCVPMASIYFGLKDNNHKIQQFVKTELLSSLTTYEVATAAAVVIRNSGMNLEAINADARERAGTSKMSSQNHIYSQPPQQTQPTTSREPTNIKKTSKDQIPKWFKPL